MDKGQKDANIIYSQVFGFCFLFRLGLRVTLLTLSKGYLNPILILYSLIFLFVKSQLFP